jgi:hypothetical protein
VTDEKELTKKEMEDTVGGRKTRRTTEPLRTAESDVSDTGSTEPLNDPPYGGLTPGGKSTG